MDPRSIKPGLTAVQESGTGIFHPTMIHPRTGLPLEAVGVVNGRILWPVMGASEDDDPDIEKDAEDSADEDEDDDDSEDEDEDDKDPKAKIEALTEEKDRHYKRRKKAEAERDALKKELDELKAKAKKGKTKPDKKEKPVDDDDDDDEDEEKVTLRANAEKANSELQKARLENAFLRVNAVDWVNPSHVMTLLMADDDYEVEFDDHGNVDRKSLTAELKRFAKANPHLVKPKPKKSSDDDGDDDKDASSGKSGSSMNGQRKGKGKKEPTREELAKKYPALGL